MRRNQVISKRKLISNKDYLNGVTIKELKQKYNITHIHRYVKETKKRYRLGHDRVRELIRDKAKGYSNKELGEKYKLSKASISHYLNRSL
jgi:DNA-binding NarL/FixJ family response regulator